MFGRKKAPAPAAPRKGGGDKLMAQMGMVDPTDMTSMEAMIYGGDDDEELEAELLAIAGESDAPKPKTSPKKAPVSMDALDKMVANSMKDTADSDDEDINDPELLAELQMLTTGSESPEPPVVQEPVQQPSGQSMVGLLEDRLTMYQTAMEAAKSNNDTSKARRLDRGIKTLRDLLRRAKTGKPIAEDDIPPPVSSSSRPTPVSSPMKEQATLPSPPKIMRPSDTGESMVFEPTTSGPGGSPSLGSPVKGPSPARSPVQPASPSNTSSDHSMLIGRRDQYRTAALNAKRAGDEDKARKYIKIAKQFDVVLTALDGGKPIDLSQMPPPPPEFGGASPSRTVDRSQGSSAPTPAQLANAAAAVAGARTPTSPEEEEIQVPSLAVEEKKRLFNAPTAANSVLEALDQRLEKYRASSLQAKEEGNNSKARRMGRIVKQYEDAIKAHKAGKQVDYAELPTPPGFPPIPADGPAKQPPPTPSPIMSPSSSSTQIAPQQPPQPAARSPQGYQAPPQQPHPAQPGPAAAAARNPGLQRQTSILSRAEQQAMFLQERQLGFKRAALKAKQKGDMELAKKYLRQAMGFEQMIEASKSGLPVDMSQVPALPGATNDKLEFISDKDVQQGDRNETYKKLEQELIKQIRTCTTNSEHFTKLGDISTASKFDKVCVNARKDLDSLKNAFKHGDPVPRFHYESRTYTLVKSCSDLGDDDLGITIVRGVNYHLPSDYAPTDLDTYIKYEFPFPNDDPQKGYSDTVKGTNNPEYNQSFSVNISRKSRSFLRLLKHKTLKLEIYYKRGFFKGDKLLGAATVKLQPLENACVVHESYDLADGRKAVGGKLEVKLRVREPFLGKQVEEVKEKWLIIDHFDRVLPAAKGSNTATGSKTTAPAPPPPIASIKVLEYERQLLDRQIQQMAGRLSRSQEDAMKKKSQELGQRTEEQKEQLRRGGANALREYANAIERCKAMYLQEAGMLVKQGNRDKAQILVTKKKIIEKEVEGIRAKLSKS